MQNFSILYGSGIQHLCQFHPAYARAILRVYIHVHTVTAGSWAHRFPSVRTVLRITTTNWFSSSEVLHTDLLGCGSCCLCLCPPPAITTLLENCELESKRTLVGMNQRALPQKGWAQLIFISTVYMGSKTPGEYFVLTRIENGTCAAPVGPGFWVNASIAPSNFHFAWFQDLLHFHNNFCMGPFVMSR